MDRALLEKLLRAEMPYGKYQGTRLIQLPEPYVVWICRNAMPEGELGRMFELLYEIKANGLEGLFQAPASR